VYLEDLKDNEVKNYVELISSKIDSWATTIRYHHSILSNKKVVLEVIEVCEKLITIAESRIPPRL